MSYEYEKLYIGNETVVHKWTDPSTGHSVGGMVTPGVDCNLTKEKALHTLKQLLVDDPDGYLLPRKAAKVTIDPDMVTYPVETYGNSAVHYPWEDLDDFFK